MNDRSLPLVENAPPMPEGVKFPKGSRPMKKEIEKEVYTTAVGLSITQEPEHFEELIEQALDRGPGSWENDEWLPWAIKEDLRLRSFKIGKEIVAKKRELEKLEIQIVELVQAVKQGRYELRRVLNTIKNIG